MVTIDFDKIFLIIDVIELGGTAFFGWLFVWHFEYGVIGIGIARFIVILISAVVCIVAWKMQGMKESFKKEETFAEIYLSKGFWEFTKFFLKFPRTGERGTPGVTHGFSLEYLPWKCCGDGSAVVRACVFRRVRA